MEYLPKSLAILLDFPSQKIGDETVFCAKATVSTIRFIRTLPALW